MVLDVRIEHRHLSVEQLVAGLRLLDQLLGRGVLDGRFVDQVLLLQRLARGGIEDLFFDMGMDLVSPSQISCASFSFRLSSRAFSSRSPAW